MADRIHDSEEGTATQGAEQCDFKKAHIGRNIASIRRSRGMSQDYVASKLGKSQQTISDIEATEEIPQGLLEQIAQILGVAPAFIENYDLERIINNNTQVINEGGYGSFSGDSASTMEKETDNSTGKTTNTNSLDVIKYIIAENDRLHVRLINEKNTVNRELKTEIKLLKAEIKRLNEELLQSRKK